MQKQQYVIDVIWIWWKLSVSKAHFIHIIFWHLAYSHFQSIIILTDSYSFLILNIIGDYGLKFEYWACILPIRPLGQSRNDCHTTTTCTSTISSLHYLCNKIFMYVTNECQSWVVGRRFHIQFSSWRPTVLMFFILSSVPQNAGTAS
jgi:hypothetical protein